MTAIEIHKAKISETDRQISKTNSWKRRNDLIKYKRRLMKELRFYEYSTRKNNR